MIKNPNSLVALSTQFSVILFPVTGANDSILTSPLTIVGGVNVKNTLLPFAADPMFAIKGDPTGLAPTAIVFTANVAEATNVEGAPMVIEPTVVAVLLDAIDIDLD